ncbi:hypothetical protein Mapa_012303 [Marchantia paleacea]|nr:hypothetical protein Mapa_012303 [Marchantia paleacea]
MGNVAFLSCCLSKVVRVVHPSGRVYIYTQPISIAELLLAYPHHYVCDSEGTNPKGAMLPLEMDLQLGRTYVLVPLPRLFNCVKGGQRPQPTSCMPTGLCLQAGGQRFPTFSDSDEDEPKVSRRRRGRVTLGSLFALESGCTGLIKQSYKDSSKSPITLHMQRILETAEMHWRYICQENRSWRPELESIKEEARKSCTSSPQHELSLIDHHRPLIRASSGSSSLRPRA